jgi:YD repeat-containing protein
VYNSTGQLAFIIDASGSVTGMAYGNNGQLTSRRSYANRLM